MAVTVFSAASEPDLITPLQTQIDAEAATRATADTILSNRITPLETKLADADANPLFKPVILAAAADFNTLVAEGRTVVPTNEIAIACTNRPSATAGVLDVALIGSGVFQTYRVFEFDLAYERQKLSNGTWTTWVQLASKDMVDTSAANTLQGAKDYADANALFKPVIITSGQYTNIDQITVSGHYVLALNGVASEITGLPEAKTGFISVLKNGTMVSQIYRPSDADYYYTRTSSSAGVFGSFAKIFGQAYVDNNPLFKPINLATAVNLNTLTTPYLATVTNPANITLALNFPVAGAIGTLEVLQAGQSATVFQRYTLVDSTVYVRAFPSGSWSAWTSQSAINKGAAEVNQNKIFSLESFDAKAFVQSTNLFNGAELNTSVDGSGNIITEAGRWLSGFFPIKTGEVFKIPSSSYRVAYYDENKNFLIRSGATDTVNAAAGITRGYFRLSGTNSVSAMQLNKGGTLLAYEPHYIDLKNPKAKPPIEPSDTVFFDLSKNLFDKSEVLLGKSVDTSGNIIDDIRWLGDFIPCVGSQVFSIPNDTFRIAYYDANKAFIVRSGVSGGGVTSFTTPNSGAIAYMRFSGTHNLDLMQVNVGATLLPYEVFGEQKLKTVYLPADLGIDVDALREDILSEVSVSQYEPSTPTLTLTKVEETWRQPLWLSSDGATLYGALGGQLLQSVDDWVTRVNIGAALPNSILAVRVAGDGQLLVSTARDEANSVVAKVFKTVGYNIANPSAATFTEVLAINSTQANIANNWGVSVYNNIVTVSEYGLRDVNGAKNVYLSQDNGNTFSLIFNQYTQVIAGRPELTMSAHMHTAAYDPYYNRIWVVCGDNPNTATYYSDDMGVTWTFVIGTSGTGAIQFTGIQALPNCVIFGSDRSPNGIYVYRRNGKDKMPVIKPLLIVNNSTELTHVFGLPFKRDWLPATPTYFVADRTDGTMFKPLLTATVDGGKGHILGEMSAGEALHGIFGATASGKIIVVSQTTTSVGLIISTANAPIWSRV